MGILENVEGRLDGNGYINILENALIRTRDKLSMPRGWIFQQDNATCHTSRLVKQLFNDENVTEMNWPAQSPDLRTCGIILKVLFTRKIPTTLRSYGHFPQWACKTLDIFTKF